MNVSLVLSIYKAIGILPVKRTIAFDLSDVRIIELITPEEEPPTCLRCNRAGEFLITRASNRNGNAQRPYYKCIPCRKFLRFNDDRGNDPSNPHCFCGVSSKRQVAALTRRVPRGLHFICRLGDCNFYKPFRDPQGHHFAVETEELLDQLINLRIVSLRLTSGWNSCGKAAEVIAVHRLLDPFNPVVKC